jgi:hypothetical protein
MRKYTAALLLILIVLTLESCDPSQYAAKDGQNLITAAENECPDISGTYLIMDRAGYLVLGGHYEKRPKNWEILNISGNPQQELHIRLYDGSGATNETHLKRVKDKDYKCQNGFLETAWPAEERPNRLDDAIPENYGFEKSLSFAKYKTGELVMRTNIRRWKEVSVWCGDGCRYVPIPFTSRTHYKWSRWPTETLPTATIYNENANAIESFIAEGETPEEKVKRAFSKMTRPGATLVSLSNNGKTWKAVFRGDTNSLLALHEAVQSSNTLHILDVKIDSTPTAQKEVKIEFLLPPSQEEREAKKAKEQNTRQLASAHEAADRILVKRLLPSIPKGMIITASQHDAETFLVEVRHENEDAFYELITRAVASGEFSQANIKARKKIDHQGKHVVDILLTQTSQEETTNTQTQQD